MIRPTATLIREKKVCPEGYRWFKANNLEGMSILECIKTACLCSEITYVDWIATTFMEGEDGS